MSQTPGEYIKTTTVPDGIFPEKKSLIGAEIDEVFSLVQTYRQTDVDIRTNRYCSTLYYRNFKMLIILQIFTYKSVNLKM